VLHPLWLKLPVWMLCAPAHVKIEYGMAEREMRDLDEPILKRADVEVDVAQLTELVVFLEAGKAHDVAAPPARGRNSVDDIRGGAGVADRDHDIAGGGEKVDLLDKDFLIAEIVAEASQGCSVGEGKRAQAAVLRKIDGEMAGNALAPAIADEDELVVAVMC